MFDISLRVWFVHGWDVDKQGRAHNITDAHRDTKTGRIYVELKGHDAFAVARLIPQDWIELVTLRHDVPYDIVFPSMKLRKGTYTHKAVSIIVDEFDIKAHTPVVNVSVVGQDLKDVEEAYRLLRQGKLQPESWIG